FEDTPQRITTDTTNQQAPYYSYYDGKANTLLLYPAGTTPGWPPNEERNLQWDGYGSVTKLNDHHYTYGYYVSAAALMTYADPSFGDNYKYVINQLIFDVAYDPDTCSQIPHLAFPKTRLWDSYTGHCQASGMTYTDYSGNSDESISEEIQFWAGVIRWGTATDQNEITNLGVTRYTQAVYAYYTYWRDYFNTYPALWVQAKGPGFDPGWISLAYVPQIWDGKAKTSTFFGTYPTGESVITSLPATSASFYQAIDKSWITSYTTAYEAYLKKWNMDPQHPQGYSAADPTQPWYSQLAYYGEMACWYAMADPSGALSKFFPLDPTTALTPDPTYQTLPINVYTEKGKDAAQVYHFVRFLQDYGVPEPLAAFATNTPYSMVFVKNGVKTYVGFNPGAAMMDIRFNDGTVIANVSPRQFGFWPVGAPEPVQASFTVSPESGSSPLVVTFTDTSKGSLTGWAWTFGDGGSSSEQNPVHTFTSPGAFEVNLTVTDVSSKT
ncbi:MAG: hypothetical protein CVV33_10370, partial [Methanomicrobiales archaeon HGW-Methanomicrobiales-4]